MVIFKGLVIQAVFVTSVRPHQFDYLFLGSGGLLFGR